MRTKIVAARRATTIALAWLLLAGTAWPQGVEYIKANYTKHEHQVAMRDGVKLFTAVYVPKDASRRYPILLTRTPYGAGPYGEDRYPNALVLEQFAREGYIFVTQDVRGRNKSEGEFVNIRPIKPVKNGPADTDESTDTWDTVDWLVKNVPQNNGRVGMWGISYPGFYAAAGLIDAHPALKAVSPEAPIADWFVGDDFHHNGALYLAHSFGFLSLFGRPPDTPRFVPGTPDGYRFFLDIGPLSNVNARYFKGQIGFWNEMMEHPNYDAFWQARNLRPHLKNIKPAVMTVGGWFDAEDLFGALNVYQAVEKSSPGTYNILVMGPWFHGGWLRSDGDALGNARFGSKTGAFYREKIFAPFFDYYLKGSGDLQVAISGAARNGDLKVAATNGKGELKLPEAYVFETGANAWRAHDAWPPRQAAPKSIYLQAGGRLSFDAPRDRRAPAFDEYISDPARPVPYIPGIAYGMTREHMTDDQRSAATRPDVLVYQTDALAEDVTVAGPVSPDLYVSTTGTDSDFVVKLIDVYPNDTPDNEPSGGVRMGGYQQLVRGEAMRGRFRNSYEKPEPFVPGKVTRIRYTMPDVFHTFRRGHRIMIQIQSSWFPLVDRNPQKFVDIYKAKAEDFQKATQRVYHAPGNASSVTLLVLK